CLDLAYLSLKLVEIKEKFAKQIGFSVERSPGKAKIKEIVSIQKTPHNISQNIN
ncbi:hypothetical protein HMPREF3224_01428, partial [Anaerococcus hydrogenalis]